LATRATSIANLPTKSSEPRRVKADQAAIRRPAPPPASGGRSAFGEVLLGKTDARRSHGACSLRRRCKRAQWARLGVKSSVEYNSSILGSGRNVEVAESVPGCAPSPVASPPASGRAPAPRFTAVSGGGAAADVRDRFRAPAP
jgi:hypothetical protein